MALDPEVLTAAERIADAIDAASEEVDIAMDEDADPDEVRAAHDAVNAVVGEYRALLGPLDPSSRKEIQRMLGLKIDRLKAELRRVG